MAPDPEILVGEWIRSGRDDRGLRRDDSLIRLRRGVYVKRDQLEATPDDQRYDLRIRAVLGTRRSPLVLSHYSAARLHALPIAGRWPHAVHATVHPGSHRRSKNGVVVHRHSLADDEVVETDGILLTSLLRTVLDVARAGHFRHAVGMADHVLRLGLLTAEDLSDSLANLGVGPGSASAQRVLAFADERSASVGESVSRVLIRELGFPDPELQAEFATPSGRRFADFWWPHLRLVGEFDGRVKYQAEPEEVIWAEKARENELRDLGVSWTRWTWRDLMDDARMTRRLEAAGLRRRRPRGYSARTGQ